MEENYIYYIENYRTLSRLNYDNDILEIWWVDEYNNTFVTFEQMVENADDHIETLKNTSYIHFKEIDKPTFDKLLEQFKQYENIQNKVEELKKQHNTNLTQFINEIEDFALS